MCVVPIIRALIPVSALVQGVYYMGKPGIYIRGFFSIFENEGYL